MEKKDLINVVDKLTFVNEYTSKSLEEQFERGLITEKEYDSAVKKRKVTQPVNSPETEVIINDFEDALDF